MQGEVSSGSLKIWCGIECTINRIGDKFKDQLEYSGHYDRRGDIWKIANLGIKTIRYPILWEKHAPRKNAKIDWRWADSQLANIRASGMKPIAGLLHHGSGPPFTNLLDPEFPYLFAEYAYAVASRYPWIQDYTPVNEPLTTARFSGLYGLWFPHHTNEGSFYTMLLNQLKAIVLAMEAIRCVNSSATLIQTEDLGKTYSTSLLSYQAAFENERRLLTFDILTGRLQPDHPQYAHMRSCGVTEKEMDFFQGRPCAPDILGLNYYITSERWLDESIEKYDPKTHGGNGIHRYADTEVVRGHPQARGGFQILATEIWERYGVTMAVTECHLHCTREEQLRWFKGIWDDALCLRAKKIDIKAVTAWALFGSFDWGTLLTKTGTQYESGVFDIASTGQLRPTAIANHLRDLAGGKSNPHPVLSGPGWWNNVQKMIPGNCRPLIILNSPGRKDREGTKSAAFAAALAAACNQRCLQHIVATSLDDLDIEKLGAWAIIDLGSDSLEIAALQLRANLQFISFASGELPRSCLKIIVERMPITVHQINKVLDLIIDGVKGSWVISSGDKLFKKESILDVLQLL